METSLAGLFRALLSSSAGSSRVHMNFRSSREDSRAKTDWPVASVEDSREVLESSRPLDMASNDMEENEDVSRQGKAKRKKGAK